MRQYQLTGFSMSDDFPQYPLVRYPAIPRRRTASFFEGESRIC